MILRVKKLLMVLLAGVLALSMGVAIAMNMPTVKADGEATLSISMENGLSVRTEDPIGIRFRTYVNRAYVDANQDNIEIVVMITPTRNIGDKTFDANFGGDNDKIVKKIVFSNENGNLVDNGDYVVPGDETNYWYHACITGLQEQNIARDFSARSYVLYNGVLLENSYTDIAQGNAWNSAQEYLKDDTVIKTETDIANAQALCASNIATITGFNGETYPVTVKRGQTVAQALEGVDLAKELNEEGAAYYKGIVEDTNVELTENAIFTAKMNSLIIENGVVIGSTITAEDTTVIKVPATYAGVAVTGINRAFNGTNCPASVSITKVYAPSVTDIYGGAFSGCTSLTYVDLSGLSGTYPYSTSNQGWFSNCTALTTLILGESFDFSGNAECFSYWVDDSTVGYPENAILDIYISSESGKFVKPTSYKNTLLSGNVYNYDADGACGKWMYNEDETDVILMPGHKNDVNNFGVCSVCGKDATEGISYIYDESLGGYVVSSGVAIDQYTMKTAYTGTDKIVYVRATYNDKPVVAIGKQAFSGNTNITRVYAPSVTGVYGSAFSGCTSLEYIDLSSVTKCDYGTYNQWQFANCTSLKTLILGASFDASGNANVFQADVTPEKPILDIYLSSSNGTFKKPDPNTYASNLLSSNVYQKDENGACGKWMYNEDKTDVVLAPDHKNDVNNFGVCSVCGKDATNGITYEEATVKNGSNTYTGYIVTGYTGSDKEVYVREKYNGSDVVAIGTAAFKNKTITKAYLPESVKVLFNNAFGYCTSLTYVSAPGWEYSTYTAYINDVAKSCDRIFENCNALETVVLGSSFNMSGNAWVFSADAALEEPILDIYLSSANGTFTSNGYDQFLLSNNVYKYDADGACGTWKYNEDKTDVVLAPAHKNDVNNFGVCSVCGKDMTSGITYEEATVKNGSNTYTGYIVTGYTGSDKEVYVREKYNGLDVVAIDKGAFKNKTTITKAYLPESVKVLFNSAFGGCTSLTYVSAPGWEYSTYWANVNDTDKECDKVFNNCTALETVVLGSSFNMSGNAWVFSADAALEEPILDIYLSSANGTFTSNGYDQFLLGDNYNVYYYSEEQPTDTSKTYWHYDETTGLAVLWN